MADGDFWGDRTKRAEIDICAANYLRHRIRQATDAFQDIVEGLEAKAQEFLASSDAHVATLANGGGDPEEARKEREIITRVIARDIAGTEPGPERIALCNRMIVDAGASDALQTLLWLLGEELVLPREGGGVLPQAQGGGAPPQSQAQQSVRQPQSPQRKVQPQRQVQPQERAPAQLQRPAQPALPVPTDEFFGVNVPSHEIEKARAIKADARARAETEGHLGNSRYVASRGQNAWQQKLLRAEFDAAMAERNARTASVPSPATVAPQEPVVEEAEVGTDAESEALSGSTELEVHGAEGLDGGTDEAEFEGAEEAGHDATGSVSASEADAPEMVSAEPAEEDFGESDGQDEPYEGGAVDADLFAEPVDEEHDEAPVMAAPLAPPPRPPTTPMPAPPPPPRNGVPPVRPASGAGLMSPNVAPRPRPTFVPRG